ncbi:MAG: carbohydrate ABC transporter permease [Marmoricola sp.]
MTHSRLLKVLSAVSVVLFLVVWVFPIAWTAITSLKLPVDIFAYPPSLSFSPSPSNYQEVLGGDESVLSGLLTSVIISVTSTFLAMLFGAPVAYVFARIKMLGKGVLALYTMFTYLIPRIGLVIPLFVIMRKLDLTDTYIGLIIVYLSFALPLAIWLMVAYFEVVPIEIEEAARCDGASRLLALWHVVLPQVRGGMAATTVFVFITAWNEFLFAIVLGGDNVHPITVSMYDFISVQQTLWGPLTATAVIAMLPVVALGLVAQKEIVKGLSAGAVK